MTAGQAGNDLDAFATRLQRVVVTLALAGVLAGVLTAVGPDVLARIDDEPEPTAQTVFDAIHATYEFPDKEGRNFYFCVPKKHRATFRKADPDTETQYVYDPEECLDAVLTDSLDVYEMADEDQAKSLVNFNSPWPGQAEPSDWRWRQSGRFVLAWHSRIKPADPHQFEGMVRVADRIVLGRHRLWTITVVATEALLATVVLTAIAWAARRRRGRAATAR